MDAKNTDMMNSIGLLVLRLGIGGFMASHGWGKVQMIFNGQFEMMGDPIGLGPHLSLVAVAGAEFLCALLVVIGLGTRFAAAPVVFAMTIAAFAIHSSDPLTMSEGARLFFAGEAKSWASKEPALLFALAFFALVFTGAGKLSIDGLIWPWWTKQRAKKRVAGKV